MNKLLTGVITWIDFFKVKADQKKLDIQKMPTE